MHALWQRQQVVANNLANASTAGFKRDDPLILPAVPATAHTGAVGGIPPATFRRRPIRWTGVVRVTP